MNEERKIETEQVDAVTPPPRARVTEAFERKRDYLTGFLSGETKPVDEAPANEDVKNSVIDALKSIYDPEIPVDIYELSVPGVRDAEVKLVWDPPWDPSKMSDEARLELGML